MERCLLRERPETEHVQILAMETRLTLLPLAASLGSVEEALAQTLGFLLQPAFDHGVAWSWLLRLLSLGGAADAAKG
jgi:hypothetical protein